MKITLEINLDVEKNRLEISVKSPHGASAEITVPVEVSPLTEREVEVLGLLANGKTVKEISSCLDLSIKTVDVHKQNLMRKLGIHNKVQLVQYAIRNGFIRIEGVEVIPIDRSA